MHLLYPKSPLHSKQPDEQFEAEVNVVRSAGFEVSLFSLEDFQSGTFRSTPPLPVAAEILYRGWMFSAAEYEALVSAISSAGAHPVTDSQTYLASHHLPNWYPALSDLTPETRVYPPDCDLETELRALDWPEYFIKDYVKSLKTSIGSRISMPEHVTVVVSDMRRFRGVIEGGFCVRRVENFLPNTERRYFVLDGVRYAALGEAPPIVHECAKRLRSRFYSVDVVQRIDGGLRVVEVGDGQVSDLVGWTPEQFVSRFTTHFSHKN
ncbi:MAG: ATP-grasp domain-containing protein [Verrucomicrobia bacterium]|nr:ATP-grasp domain-containing protein [Verrucomicrobiota bacterium]